MKTPSGYSRLQIALHWAIALLIVAQLINHEGMQTAWQALQKGLPFEAGPAQVHVIIGVLILVLAVIRLVVRWRRGVPDLPEGGKPFLDKTAMAAHMLLYGLLVLIPLLGVAAWFFGITTAAGMHGALFTVLMVLIGLHTLAALYHQYVVKDGLIRRMMRAE
ncbi:MAG: cytochrome b [Paracoccaceae bacterium]